MSQETFIQLLYRYISDELSPGEKEQLQRMMQQPEYAEPLEAFVREVMMSDEYSAIDSSAVKNEIDAYLSQHINPGKPVYYINTRFWLRIASAIIILTGMAVILFYLPRPEINTASPEAATNTKHIQDVAAPQNNKAVITLANGQQINLSDAAAGSLSTEANADIIRMADGRIIYNAKGKTAETALNLLTVPQGSNPVHITLSDGSRIWVNTGSSIKYPVVFTGNDRVVEMSGEAYFEIAPRKNAPFVVKKINDDTHIKVIGTHFNVNAYDNETSVQVTLIQGAVNVLKGGREMAVKPGQQAVVSNNNIRLNNHPDLEKIMSWKNNEFIFENDDIETIMRQVSRWYDIEAVITRYSDRKYIGRIDRNVPLSQVLGMFEKLGYMHFEISGRKVTVVPFEK